MTELTGKRCCASVPPAAVRPAKALSASAGRLLALALVLTTTGCEDGAVIAREVGDTLILERPWWVAAVTAAPGAGLMAFWLGVCVFRPQHSRWGKRAILAGGLLLAGVPLTVEPFTRAYVTSDSVEFRGGTFGSVVERVELEGLKRVTLSSERRTEIVGRSTREERVEIAVWESADGEQQTTEFAIPFRRVAIARFLEHVRDAGVPIEDRRNE